MEDKCIDEKVRKIFNLIDKAAKKFKIKKEYVMIRLEPGNPSYSAKIRIFNNERPMANKKFLDYVQSKILEKFKDISSVNYDDNIYEWTEEGIPF